MGKVELDAETEATVEEIATHTGESRDDVVRRAVRELGEPGNDDEDDESTDDDG